MYLFQLLIYLIYLLWSEIIWLQLYAHLVSSGDVTEFVTEIHEDYNVAHCSGSQDTDLFKFQLSYFDKPFQGHMSCHFCGFRALKSGHLSHYFSILGQEVFIVVWKMCNTVIFL